MYTYVQDIGPIEKLIDCYSNREISKVLSPEFLLLLPSQNWRFVNVYNTTTGCDSPTKFGFLFFFKYIPLSGSIVKFSIVKIADIQTAQTEKDIENPTVVEIAATTIRLRQNGDRPTVKWGFKKKQINIRDGFFFQIYSAKWTVNRSEEKLKNRK